MEALFQQRCAHAVFKNVSSVGKLLKSLEFCLKFVPQETWPDLRSFFSPSSSDIQDCESFWGMSMCVVPGDLPAAGRAQQGDGVPDAPQQHPWSRGHVHAGRAAWSCHHAQPLPALPEGQHLCKPLSVCEHCYHASPVCTYLDVQHRQTEISAYNSSKSVHVNLWCNCFLMQSTGCVVFWVKSLAHIYSLTFSPMHVWAARLNKTSFQGLSEGFKE